MTAEEFLQYVHREENENRWLELVRGEVIELLPPTRQMSYVCSVVGMHVGNYLHDLGRYYAVNNDCGVILSRAPDTVRGPDMAVYDDADSFADLPKGYGEVPPLFAVEVAHPDDETDNTARKIDEYLTTGTRLVWLIDIVKRTVTVHRPGSRPFLVGSECEADCGDVLPGFSCLVGDFFRLPWEVTSPPSGPLPPLPPFPQASSPS